MIAFLAAVPAAAALVASDPDSGGTCELSTVNLSAPRSGQVDVPLDARMAFAVFGTCDHPESYTVTLERTDDAEVADEQVLPWSDRSDAGLFEMFPAAELEADTAYTLRISPDTSWGEVSELGFTTGTGHVGELSGTPTVAIDEALSPSRGQVRVDYSLVEASDPDDLSLMILDVTGIVDDTTLFAAGGTSERRGAWDADPGEICLAITQIDGLGRISEGNEACAEVVGGLCSAASGPSSVAGALLALVLAGARRRPR